MSEREEAMKNHPSYTEPVDETNRTRMGHGFARDRCDACQAQAYYLVKMIEGQLDVLPSSFSQERRKTYKS